jgi:hypothetical protein
VCQDVSLLELDSKSKTLVVANSGLAANCRLQLGFWVEGRSNESRPEAALNIDTKQWVDLALHESSFR